MPLNKETKKSKPGSNDNKGALLQPQHQIVESHTRTLVGEISPSAEMQSVYSTTPADWANGGQAETFKS